MKMIHLFNFETKRIIDLKILGISVLMLVFLIFSPDKVNSQEASLFIFPGSESFQVGEVFSIELRVDTKDMPINAAQTTIYFPFDKVEALEILKENSIFSFWPEEPTFSNSTGEISFSGGVPHPGFEGMGNIITINFKAKKEGLASFTLGQGRVLADDGKGTDILVFIKEAKYSIQKGAPEIESGIYLSSSTHPKEDEWYNNNSPIFYWNMTPEINAVSFVLDQYPETIPDTVPEGKLGMKNYENINDGVWYFHLKVQTLGGWSNTFHRRIQVDGIPPASLRITVDNAGDPTNPNPNLYFEANDITSGIDRYRLKIGGDEFFDLLRAEVSPFSLSPQKPGQYPLLVRAIDKAGNAIETEELLNIEPIDTPLISLWPSKYIAGEQTFYIEGTALPEVGIIIFLGGKDGKVTKEWLSLSDSEGRWSFSTRDLLKSGTYYLSVKARDKRGAESHLSDVYEVEVLLSGVSIGPFIITNQDLVIILGSILFFGIIGTVYFTYRSNFAKRILQNETQEAKESLRQSFDELRKEIESRIKMFDSQPDLSEEERKVYEDLKDFLKDAEDKIEKEIKDIEEELK
jgi:hypothetical protein